MSFSVLFPRLLRFTIYDNSCVMYIIESMTPKHTAANANRAADLDKLVLPSGPAACSRIIDVHHVFFRVSLNLIYICCKVTLPAPAVYFCLYTQSACCVGRIIFLLNTICQPRGSIHIHSLPYNSITLPYNFWHYWRRRRRRRFSDNKTKVAPRSSSGCG